MQIDLNFNICTLYMLIFIIYNLTFTEFISKAVVEVLQLKVDVVLLHSRYEHPME